MTLLRFFGIVLALLFGMYLLDVPVAKNATDLLSMGIGLGLIIAAGRNIK